MPKRTQGCSIYIKFQTSVSTTVPGLPMGKEDRGKGGRSYGDGDVLCLVGGLDT